MIEWWNQKRDSCDLMRLTFLDISIERKTKTSYYYIYHMGCHGKHMYTHLYEKQTHVDTFIWKNERARVLLKLLNRYIMLQIVMRILNEIHFREPSRINEHVCHMSWKLHTWQLLRSREHVASDRNSH